MNWLVLIIMSLSMFLKGFSQTIVADSIAALPNEITESSGMIFYHNKLITHTDSDSKNALYEIDTNTALISKTTYNLQSIQLKSSNSNCIEIKDLSNQNYILKIILPNNTSFDFKIGKY